MVTKTSEELRALVTGILLTAGADKRNAEAVAEHLVLANLSGVDTHGVWHLPGYVTAMKNGEIVPTAWPAILQETPASALVTGNWTFGQVTARYAMELAIKKAQAENVAVVSMVQAHHTGRLGHYTEMASAERMISMVWSGGYGEEKPAAVPYGGSKAILHTNPVAFGAPAGEESPMNVDFATSAASGVKVVNAHRRHEQVPAGWIVDKHGNPTTDPEEFFDGGGHLPFGGHKGFALMLVAEFLGRVLSGADAFVEAERGGPIQRHQGVTMVVFRADMFQPMPDYACRAQELAQRVRSVPPAPGFKEVMVPGDPEAKTRTVRARDGIPIMDDIWQSIVETAKSLGIQVA